jgi:tRNA pseudouridine-54 N-methylase
LSRHFVLVHSPTPPPGFSLRGYASSSRRLDIAARALRAALYLENGVRQDTVFHLYLHDTGRYLELGAGDIPPVWNEREVMALLRERLGEARRLDANDFLERIFGLGKTVVLLEEDAPNIRLNPRIPGSSSLVVVLGGKTDVPRELSSVMVERGGVRVSIGPRRYLASHCIAFIHYVLDAGLLSHL